MSRPASHSAEPGRPTEPVAPSRASARAISSALGVFAETGRGAGIGAIIGTCVCRISLMANTAYDAVMGGGHRLPPDAMVATLALGAAWFLVLSLVACGINGAILGAMIGASFPIRRSPR
jgi:phosphotransferase system  glucose/maltose/N-acetylglucosamine-specific IIC component